MFALLGTAVSRGWPLWLGVWLVGLGAAWWLIPAGPEAAPAENASLLPPTALSRRGQELFRRAFPAESSESSIVVVLSRRDERALGVVEQSFIDHDLVPALERIAEAHRADGAGKAIASRLRAPSDRGSGVLLRSRDNAAALVVLDLSSGFQDRRNWALLADIEGLIDEWQRTQRVPDGLDIALTGSAVAGRDHLSAEVASARAVERWTIAVVIALLLLIYRAPLVAVIPLATVFVAVQISLRLLGALAEAGLVAPPRDLRVFITVIAYGAGVDYCVFLIARYREELDAGADGAAAVAQAIGHAGGAVSASAATVIGGIGMLAFATFGRIRDAGLVIPICLSVVLAAALTFAPALLRLAGPAAFWPAGLGGGRRLLPDWWQRFGALLARRPGLVWCATTAVMLPLAVVAVARYDQVDYDPLSGLPDSAPSVRGTRALERHFPPGLLGTVTVLVYSDLDLRSDEGTTAVRALTESLEARRDELALADVRSLTQPLGSSEAAAETLAGMPVPPRLAAWLVRHRALAHYVSQTGRWRGHVTRLELVLAVQPLSFAGLGYLDRIATALEEEVPPRLGPDADFFLAGAAAAVRDLRSVTRADQQRAQVLVPLAVLALLLLVFRRPLVSVYLIVSVLFSYLATLGATILVFELMDPAGHAGLDWKVPLFLFTILVAVGEDYNIFLLSRIDEEGQTHEPVAAVVRGLAHTGGIISTCGLIMAGTFAALLAGSLVAMKQLGFALALGVLLDTLVVRPILVPTFLILCERWARRDESSAAPAPIGAVREGPGRAERATR